MESITKLKKTTAILGDIIVLYISLFLTLFLRYGKLEQDTIFAHLEPFTLVFAFWLVIFYIAELYDVNSLKNDVYFYKKISIAFFWSAVVAIAIFYLIPIFIIAPKTNLFILLVIASSLTYIWRGIFNSILKSLQPSINILLIGYNTIAQEVADFISSNRQIGYDIRFWMKEGLQDKEFKHLSQIILANKINLIVVPAHIKKQSKASKLIYKNFALGVEIKDLAEIYEKLFGKIPLAELEEIWFLENLKKQHRIYDLLKRIVDFAVALSGIIVFSPILILASVFNLMLHGWPIIFMQTRMGEHEKSFELYKFRTMRADAEKAGPQWSAPSDHRVTFFGKILRRFHFDELTQLFNVLKGDMAIVGPRPERPEFAQQLQKEIPFFSIRHLIKPGITGWAQVRYKYGASVEESYEKLQYDLYYLKNRSFILDFLIILRTFKKLLGG